MCVIADCARLGGILSHSIDQSRGTLSTRKLPVRRYYCQPSFAVPASIPADSHTTGADDRHIFFSPRTPSSLIAITEPASVALRSGQLVVMKSHRSQMSR